MTLVEKRSKRTQLVAYALIGIMLAAMGYGVGVWSAPVTSFGIDGSGNINVNGINTNTLRLDALTAGRVPVAGVAGLLDDSTAALSDAFNNPELTASYVVWVDGATYYARNGHTGAVTSNADATTLIKAIIASLPATGGKIHLSDGLFIFQLTYPADIACIRLPSNVHLSGNGRSTILKLADNVLGGTTRAATIIRNDADDSHNIVISDLVINGNKANNNPTTAEQKMSTGGIYLIKNYNCEIRGVEIYNTVAAGINIETPPTTGSNHIQVENVIIHGTGHVNATTTSGFVLDTVTGITVNNLITYGCPVGVDLSAATYSTLSNINTHNNTAYGIRLVTASNHNTLSTVIAKSNGDAGIYIGASGYNTLNGAISTYNKHGIVLEGAGATFNDITGSSFSYNQRNGIVLVTTAPYNNIVGNMFLGNSQAADNTYAAIEVLTGYNNIKNNKVMNLGVSHRYGIQIYAASPSNVVTNNDLRSSGATLIINDQDGTTIIKNNDGYVTESSGTATLLNGQNHVHVTHGLSYTPTAGDISITFTEIPTNASTGWRVGNITSAEYIFFENDPGASNLDFSWSAHKTP
jgi:parallel beta-helix repeat protein